MMAAQVIAELKFRDGQREEIIVKVDNHLNSLINGINQLNASVSQLLSELVERENGHRDCTQGLRQTLKQVSYASSYRDQFQHPSLGQIRYDIGEEHKEDGNEEDEPEDSPISEPQPPTKRTKTCEI